MDFSFNPSDFHLMWAETCTAFGLHADHSEAETYAILHHVHVQPLNPPNSFLSFPLLGWKLLFSSSQQTLKVSQPTQSKWQQLLLSRCTSTQRRGLAWLWCLMKSMQALVVFLYCHCIMWQYQWLVMRLVEPRGDWKYKSTWINLKVMDWLNFFNKWWL